MEKSAAIESRLDFQSFVFTAAVPPVSSAIMRMGPCMFWRAVNSGTLTSLLVFVSADRTSEVERPVASSV